MGRGVLFSPLECYISDAAKAMKREPGGFTAGEILTMNGSLIHSFINEFVNIVIIKDDEYFQLSNNSIKTDSLVFVTPNWVFDSFESATILPYQSYNPHPYSIFAECYFYLIADSKDSILSLSEAITHFGGSIVFDKSMYITHYVIAQEVHTTHPIKGITSKGVSVLSEATLWDCISNKTKLRRGFHPSNNILPGKEPDVPFVQESNLFQNTLFLVIVDHPYKSLLIINRYERSLLHQLLRRHGGEVNCITHTLDATALFSLQQTAQQVVLLTYTTSPLTCRLCQLHPELITRTPYWVYDIMERTIVDRYRLLYTPHSALDLYGYCFTVFCTRDQAYYKRLIESCNGLVCRLLACSVVLAETVGLVPREVVKRGLVVIRLQWIEDCVRSNCILPFSSYFFDSIV